MKVQRYVRWYDPRTDKFVGEVTIDTDLPRLQAIVGASSNDLMYDCWPVSSAVVEQLTNSAPADKRLVFFLEADGVSDEP